MPISVEDGVSATVLLTTPATVKYLSYYGSKHTFAEFEAAIDGYACGLLERMEALRLAGGDVMAATARTGIISPGSVAAAATPTADDAGQEVDTVPPAGRQQAARTPVVFACTICGRACGNKNKSGLHRHTMLKHPDSPLGLRLLNEKLGKAASASSACPAEDDDDDGCASDDAHPASDVSNNSIE